MKLGKSITTLLVVTRDRVIRAEFSSARDEAPTSLMVNERPETDDPIAGVVGALGSVKGAPGRVFVLSTDIWTRTLEMPAGNIANLSDEERRYSLAFEAEPLSGLAASEAATAVVPLSTTRGMQTVWLTQTASHVLAEIDEVVRGARGKLAGVLHPGGVPVGLDPPGSPSNARVEFWPDVTLRFAYADGAPTTARIDELKGLGRAAIVDEWSNQREQPAIEVLCPEFRPAAEPTWLSWNDEAVLGRWLAAWNRALSQGAATVPVLRPVKPPMTAQQRNRYATIIAAIVLCGCFGHRFWVQREVQRAAAEQARLEAPGKELAALRTQLTQAETATKKLNDELQQRRTDVEHAETTLDLHRRRIGQLLRRLSRDQSQDWVLQRIDGNPREVTLVGQTMHPEHISQLAAQLAHELASMGWTVEPPEQSARNLQNDGGPWRFTLRLHDQSALPTAPAAQPVVEPNVVLMP